MNSVILPVTCLFDQSFILCLILFDIVLLIDEYAVDPQGDISHKITVYSFRLAVNLR